MTLKSKSNERKFKIEKNKIKLKSKSSPKNKVSDNVLYLNQSSSQLSKDQLLHQSLVYKNIHQANESNPECRDMLKAVDSSVPEQRLKQALLGRKIQHSKKTQNSSKTYNTKDTAREVINSEEISKFK